MCKHGDTVECLVPVAARDAAEGIDIIKLKQIDGCIAPLVEALNAIGWATRSSCCGHGRGRGEILLQDGRMLLIVSDL